MRASRDQGAARRTVRDLLEQADIHSSGSDPEKDIDEKRRPIGAQTDGENACPESHSRSLDPERQFGGQSPFKGVRCQGI